MGNVEEFNEKVKKCLERDLNERRKEMAEVEKNMKEILEQKEIFDSAAQNVLNGVIYPRMGVLARKFENSTIGDINIPCLSCSCAFSHTQRFPATVTMGFSLFPVQGYAGLAVHYKLDIFPMLMEFGQHAERTFSLGPSLDGEAGEWVENKILEFLGEYLKLETHPLYQKDNLVKDPVCGMKIPITSAAASLEQEGCTLYFCSEACRDDFLRKKNKVA